MATGKQVFGVTVAKNLSPRTDAGLVVGSLVEAVARAVEGEIPLLHWLGTGKLPGGGAFGGEQC